MKLPLSILCIFATQFISAQSVSLKKEIRQHRAQYKADFKAENYSPFYEYPKYMKKMRFFSAKKDYVITGTIELTPAAKPFDLATYSGMTKPFRQYAWMHFEWEGSPKKLAIYQSLNTIRIPMYRENLFLPFKDHTSGDQSYGGGRYLDFEISDIKDNKITLDFNKAYNPYCAYSDGYNCPIPPVENHMDIAVRAGEKMYKGPKLKRP